MIKTGNGSVLLTQGAAKKIVAGMCIFSFVFAIIRTFIDQDFIDSMVGISSGFIMYYLFRNPEFLMVSTWDEFDEQYEKSRDKKYLWGFPLYQLLMLSAGLYIYLV